MARRWIALVVCAALLAGCGGGAGDEEAAPCPTLEPGGDLSVLPKGLGLEELGTVTQAFRQGRDVVAEVISETSIVELYPPMARAVLAAGYDILSSENEGFEAEIFFIRGSKIAAAYRLREGPCEGQVTIRLIYSKVPPTLRRGQDSG